MRPGCRTPTLPDHRLAALPLLVLALATTAPGCARSPYDRAWVSRELASVHGPLGPEHPEAPSLPPGLAPEEGLDASGAVAVALWNSAQLRRDLAQLGVSRADLAEAGTLPNPSFSLLLPMGPRTIETSLLAPLSALVQMPVRTAAASLQVEQVARGLVQSGLDLARDVRLAHADWLLAEGRRTAREELSALWTQTSKLVDVRLAAGDASQVEAAAIRAEALTAEDDALRARTDALLARERLRLLMGLADGPLLADVRPRADAPRVAPLRPLPELVKLAQAARPDVRAAELGVESAGKRVGWEKTRILQLFARLDAKPISTPSGNTSILVPGAQLEVPLFNWNPGGIGRAEAELERASARYLLVRQQVSSEVLTARAQTLQAALSLESFQSRILPALTSASDGARRAFEAGDLPYLQVLDPLRRLQEARLRTLELEADLRRAIAQLDRSLGIQGMAHE